MLKKVLAKLGRVMIKMGTHLLHLSRPKLAFQQPDFILGGNKKDSGKVQNLMKDPWQANCE